jgi:release factor glutamine methyltransferase
VPEWTIKALLEWIDPFLKEKGVDAPRLCAELLICHVLKKERIQLYTEFDYVLTPAQLTTLRALVKRASEHEPVAYLVGKTEFYSLELAVSPACLIPRPETELLVQHSIEYLRGQQGQTRMLDLCTGSACIAVAVAKNVPETRIIATDICDEALSMAAKNVEKYGLGNRVQLLSGDLFDPILPALDNGRFDLIVSNPPYVTDAEMAGLDANVRDYEPVKALQAGTQGLDVIERILERAAEFLTDQGALMMEIGYQQRARVETLLSSTGRFGAARFAKDHQGHDRIVMAERSA